MSKIEEIIRSEEETVQKKAQTKEAAEQHKRKLKWQQWVKEEKPRIAKFHEKIDRLFPCLKGDFRVEPRETPDYMADPFTAIVTVRGNELKIRMLESKYNLFIPYQEHGAFGYGWETKYTQYELKSDADLKKYIKEHIRICDYQAEESRRYYDSLPIGNTD